MTRGRGKGASVWLGCPTEIMPGNTCEADGGTGWCDQSGADGQGDQSF
jgi:hypothetical protein